MSDLKVTLNYVEAATMIKGMRAWLNKVETMLDEAVKNNVDYEELDCRKPNNGVWP